MEQTFEWFVYLQSLFSTCSQQRRQSLCSNRILYNPLENSPIPQMLLQDVKFSHRIFSSHLAHESCITLLFSKFDHRVSVVGLTRGVEDFCRCTESKRIVNSINEHNQDALFMGHEKRNLCFRINRFRTVFGSLISFLFKTYYGRFQTYPKVEEQ